MIPRLGVVYWKDPVCDPESRRAEEIAKIAYVKKETAGWVFDLSDRMAIAAERTPEGDYSYITVVPVVLIDKVSYDATVAEEATTTTPSRFDLMLRYGPDYFG